MTTVTFQTTDRRTIASLGSIDIGWIRFSPSHRGWRVMLAPRLGQSATGWATYPERTEADEVLRREISTRFANGTYR